MFFSFSPTEILYISSRVLLYIFRFSFSFCVNNGLEKKKNKKDITSSANDSTTPYYCTQNISHLGKVFKNRPNKICRT